MPIVIVHMFRGRSIDQKRRLASAITDAMVVHAGAAPDNLIVQINEVEPENWAQGGRLGVDDEKYDAGV